MNDEQAQVAEITEVEPNGNHPIFAEAPYSGNVRTRIHGYDWQLTVRAGNSDEFKKKINGLMTWLDAKTEKPIAVAPQPPAAPNGGTPAPVATAIQPAAVMTLHVVRMTVAPRTDGKVDLKFFEAGHQWSDIGTARTPADAVTLLKATGAWTLDHFVGVQDYPVNMVIDYKNSAKMNKNGKPYKDIITVSPAA